MIKPAPSLATQRQDAASPITWAASAPAEPNVAVRDRREAIDQDVDRLQREVRRLGTRCRAREHALEHLSCAVLTLRRANHALKDENALLRLELERLHGREASRR